MANQNLSQFGENTSVSDADYTFVWDSAASISKKVSRNSWLNSGELTSSAPVTISQTWGTTGIYTAAKVNVTETATANSASRLLDLQVGGVSLANFSKAGHLIFPSSSTVTPSGPGVGQWVGTLALFGTGGSLLVTGSGGALNISGNILLSWNNDTVLLRDGAANTLALRNGAGVPQTFRVYNTFLGTTANEWFEIDWKVSAGTVRLFTMHGGTGVARNIDISAGATLFFGAGSGSPIKMYSGNVERWNISATGHFIAAADNSYDIGASGASRPRDIYAGTSVRAGNRLYAGNGGVEIGNTAYFYWGNRSMISSPADSLILFQNVANTDFNRLQLGGTTDAFPAIARDGAGIKFTGAAAGSTAWIKVPPVAVTSLPDATVAGVGARAFVNDALSPVFGNAVANGGSAKVPVYSDGSAWYVG